MVLGLVISRMCGSLLLPRSRARTVRGVPDCPKDGGSPPWDEPNVWLRLLRPRARTVRRVPHCPKDGGPPSLLAGGLAAAAAAEGYESQVRPRLS
jgi:hypothetical protein